MINAGAVVDFRNSTFSCQHCGVRDGCLGRDLETAGSDRSRQRLLRGGSYLFRLGEPSKSLYVVRSGAIKSYATSEDGEEQILGFHSPGDVIGFDALADGHHACSAMALETSSVCRLPFDALSKLCRRSREQFELFVRFMSGETLRLADVLLLRRRTAEQRVATFLLGLSKHQEERGYSPMILTLPMSRTDIGKYLGLTVETVSRVLTRFQDLGLIAKERTQVRLLDLAALQRVANEAADTQQARIRAAGV